MNIGLNNNSSLNFQSRNPQIRSLDKLCRKVCVEFPALSSTKLGKFKCIKNTTNTMNLLSYASDKVGYARSKYTHESRSYSDEFINSINILKKNKIGNCEEYANASYISLVLNNVPNVHKAQLYAYNPKTKQYRDIDHIVTTVGFKPNKKFKIYDDASIYSPRDNQIVPFDNKIIIVDSWAGFVDYGKNCKTKYSKDELYDGLEKGEQLCFLPYKPVSFNNKQISHLITTYPRLLKDNTSAVEYMENPAPIRPLVISDKVDTLFRKRHNLFSFLHKIRECLS